LLTPFHPLVPSSKKKARSEWLTDEDARLSESYFRNTSPSKGPR
jgi:hypothetical protein